SSATASSRVHGAYWSRVCFGARFRSFRTPRRVRLHPDRMNRVHPLNVLWAIDHVCYDGSLHGGGRLYWNLLPEFSPQRVRVVACLLRASDEIRSLFQASPVPVRILDKGKYDPTTLVTFLRLIRRERIDVMHLHCYGAS